MKSYIKIAILLLAFNQGVLADQNDLQNQPLYSRVYDPARNAFDDGRAALELAEKTGRRVVIVVGGNWCAYCHQLDVFMNREHELREQFISAFVLLKVNVSDLNDNARFLSAFTRITGYPHMFLTESNGKVIYSQDPSLLRENKDYSAEKFRAFINEWKLK